MKKKKKKKIIKSTGTTMNETHSDNGMEMICEHAK